MTLELRNYNVGVTPELWPVVCGGQGPVYYSPQNAHPFAANDGRAHPKLARIEFFFPKNKIVKDPCAARDKKRKMRSMRRSLIIITGSANFNSLCTGFRKHNDLIGLCSISSDPREDYPSSSEIPQSAGSD